MEIFTNKIREDGKTGRTALYGKGKKNTEALIK